MRVSSGVAAYLRRGFVDVHTKQSTKIDISTKPLSIKEYSTNKLKYNYNFEEQKGFTEKVNKAQEQRNLIEQLETKQILPRRLRRIYDKPKYDLDITKYNSYYIVMTASETLSNL